MTEEGAFAFPAPNALPSGEMIEPGGTTAGVERDDDGDDDDDGLVGVVDVDWDEDDDENEKLGFCKKKVKREATV